MALLLKTLACFGLLALAAQAAPCGPETLVWVGQQNIWNSKMEMPPTDGVCYPITNQDADLKVKVCGPGTFKFSPFSCSNHGSYATGDVNMAQEPGDACKTFSAGGRKFGEARKHSGGGSYTVQC